MSVQPRGVPREIAAQRDERYAAAIEASRRSALAAAAARRAWAAYYRSVGAEHCALNVEEMAERSEAAAA